MRVDYRWENHARNETLVGTPTPEVVQRLNHAVAF